MFIVNLGIANRKIDTLEQIRPDKMIFVHILFTNGISNLDFQFLSIARR